MVFDGAGPGSAHPRQRRSLPPRALKAARFGALAWIAPPCFAASARSVSSSNDTASHGAARRPTERNGDTSSSRGAAGGRGPGSEPMAVPGYPESPVVVSMVGDGGVTLSIGGAVREDERSPALQATVARLNADS